MPKEKNLCGKTRPKDNPYEIWDGIGPLHGWAWNVLKKWQSTSNEAANIYARWFCNVTSPYMPNGEMGDVYVRDIKSGAVLRDSSADTI